MAETERNSSSSTTATSIIDLNVDSLVHCASYLSLQDISNLATSCKFLNGVANSDSIWQRLYRERWPQQIAPTISQTSGAREAYLTRHAASQQFKFSDPLVVVLYTDSKPFGHILFDKNDIILSRGSSVHSLNIDSFLNGKKDPLVTLSDHRARITCMRLFPLSETSLFRSETQRKENVLLTSSCDHSIRLWSKGSCQRCFRGHNGPVSILSDNLLGDGLEKVFASGGVDGTVRLWSLGSCGKRGKQALKATLYGHEKPVMLMSVARHRTSLLVSMSKDSKIRVWDATASSSVRSFCCVGMVSVAGTPVGMKCHESLVYVAAGSSVNAIDLRTMKKVFTSINDQELYSFEIMPSKSLICAGGLGRAMLWDIRRSSETVKAESVAELDGNVGPVTHLHMDGYKIVTGGSQDSCVNIWEVETGMHINSLSCFPRNDLGIVTACSAMAVNGSRIVTSSCDEEQGALYFRDFNNATFQVTKDDDASTSKFWGPQSYDDTDESE